MTKRKNSSKIRYRRHHSRGIDRQNNYQREIADSILSINETLTVFVKKADHESTEKNKSFREYVTIFLLFLTFIATGYLAMYTKGLWVDTHALLVEAENSSFLDKRAWVAPVNPSFQIPPKINEPVNAIVNVLNTGRTPANKLHIEQKMNVVPAAKYLTNHGLRMEPNETCTKVDELSGGVTLFPDKDYPIRSGIPPNSNFLYSTNLLDQSYILVWQGCFLYETFNQIHSSKFCFWLRPKYNSPFNDWTWDHCSTGNEAD